MYDAVVHQIAHRVVLHDTSVQVHYADVSGQSGTDAWMALSTNYAPNVGLDERGTSFTSIADGDVRKGKMGREAKSQK